MIVQAKGETFHTKHKKNRFHNTAPRATSRDNRFMGFGATPFWQKRRYNFGCLCGPDLSLRANLVRSPSNHIARASLPLRAFRSDGFRFGFALQNGAEQRLSVKGFLPTAGSRDGGGLR